VQDKESPAIRVVDHYAPVYRSQMAEKYNDQYDSGVSGFVIRCPWCGTIVDSPVRGGRGQHPLPDFSDYCGLFELSIGAARVANKYELPIFNEPGSGGGMYRRLLDTLRRGRKRHGSPPVEA
jgi:hypothetical protein